MALDVHSFVREDLVILDLEAKSKEEVLDYMTNELLARGFVKESFPQAIQDREAQYPSAIPFETHSIAIPHTDANHVNQSVIFFVRLKNKLEFKVMGDPNTTTQVKFVSMFALKNKEEIGEMLTSLISSYQDNEFLDQLHSAETEKSVYQLLVDRLSKK